MFIDPGRGSTFDRYGNPIQFPGSEIPAENHNLARYPVSIRGEQVWIDVSNPVIKEWGEGTGDR